MSMFVSSKWQRVALPTHWRASVGALFYCYITFLNHIKNIGRKVRAPRHVSALGAPNKFQNCHLDKTNMDKTSQHPYESSTARNATMNCKKLGSRWSLIFCVLVKFFKCEISIWSNKFSWSTWRNLIKKRTNRRPEFCVSMTSLIIDYCVGYMCSVTQHMQIIL